MTLIVMGLAAGFCSTSCNKQFVRIGYSCYDADSRLRHEWEELQEARASGCGPQGNGLDRCESRRLQIEQIAQDCPNDAQPLMVNAVLAYDEKQFVKAQQLLDSLFSLHGTYPDAAVLRARLALDEGNTPFALRYLEQQIALSPDYAGLRELYASALYSVGRLDEARTSLMMAQRLGAPSWRIDYSRGLIEEAAGRPVEARMFYEAALRARPGWSVAQSRIRGLDAAIPRGPSQP
jgi:tetratricopeptide (TPR) repeat protein